MCLDFLYSDNGLRSCPKCFEFGVQFVSMHNVCTAVHRNSAIKHCKAWRAIAVMKLQAPTQVLHRGHLMHFSTISGASASSIPEMNETKGLMHSLVLPLSLAFLKYHGRA
jgi:hypothetical protein